MFTLDSIILSAGKNYTKISIFTILYSGNKYNSTISYCSWARTIYYIKYQLYFTILGIFSNYIDNSSSHTHGSHGSVENGMSPRMIVSQWRAIFINQTIDTWEEGKRHHCGRRITTIHTFQREARKWPGCTFHGIRVGAEGSFFMDYFDPYITGVVQSCPICPKQPRCFFHRPTWVLMLKKLDRPDCYEATVFFIRSFDRSSPSVGGWDPILSGKNSFTCIYNINTKTTQIAAFFVLTSQRQTTPLPQTTPRNFKSVAKTRVNWLFPWTPKPCKMKVLHPHFLGYNP